MSKEERYRTTAAEANKLLRGRKIVKIKLNPFSDGRGMNATDPEIYLDNGMVLRFLTQETEVGEYGVELLVHNRPDQ